MKILNILSLILISISIISSAHAETTPAALQDKMEKAIKDGQKSQNRAEAWADERSEMLNKIREQENMKRWLEHQKKKYLIYIEKQKQAIAELERRKKESEKIKMNLEPFLDDLLVRLEQSVEKDMPFLPDEREKRLMFLKDSLNDFHTGLAERTKRMFEALQVEAGYGASAEKSEASIDIKGIPTQVNLLRMGRTALFYQTPDGKRAGRFNREKGIWEELPPKDFRALNNAMEIADKKRTPVLINLPVGRAVQ